VYARVTVSGLDRLRASLALRIRANQDLSVPLAAAGALTRDAAVRQFAVGGDPSWPPSRKTQDITFGTGRNAVTLSGHGQTGVDTGALMRSIAVEPVSGNVVKIGTNVAYARYMQFGTGEYAGHSAWTVRPKEGPRDPRGLTAKYQYPRRRDKGASIAGPGLRGSRPLPARVLAFSVGGRVFFAREVSLKGQPPRPFLKFSEELVTAIVARFARDLSPTA